MTMKYLIAGFSIILLASCEKSLDTKPNNLVIASTQFTNDSKANDAVVGIYSVLYGSSYQNQTYNQNIALYTSLAADELNYLKPSTSASEGFFNNNALTSQTYGVESIWADSYSVIYQANTVIENVAAAKGVSDSARKQFTGEAKFLRAYCYFYLVNMFGDVPLETTSDYHINSTIPRTAAATVYQQIVADLKDASTLLTDNYPTAGRVRANRSAALALLARTYLYTRDWANAQATSTQLIGGGLYTLEPSYNNVFLSSSNEAILQFYTPDGFTYYEGTVNPGTGPYATAYYGVTDTLYNSFEPGDLRKAAFVNSATISGVNVNYPYKYKNRTLGGSTTEYYMALRLAEQYLIRAESLAQQGTVAGALADVNVIRERAGLADLSAAISQADLLLAIGQERKAELSFEWGDRWFDLKRTGRIDAVLGGIKGGWKSSDALFPIPQNEIQNNSTLTQNPGY